MTYATVCRITKKGEKTMKNYFTNITSIEDLKKQYFALAKKYHSDINGGSDEAMKEINAEYSDLFKVYKDIHKSIKEDSAEETYTAKESTKEAPADFINIIAALLNLDGAEVELCGRWVWIGGNTKTHKDTLNALGCHWSNNKQMWSWHYPEDSVRKHRKASTMAEIRNRYGSVSYKTNEDQLLLA